MEQKTEFLKERWSLLALSSGFATGGARGTRGVF